MNCKYNLNSFLTTCGLADFTGVDWMKAKSALTGTSCPLVTVTTEFHLLITNPNTIAVQNLDVNSQATHSCMFSLSNLSLHKAT